MTQKKPQRFRNKKPCQCVAIITKMIVRLEDVAFNEDDNLLARGLAKHRADELRMAIENIRDFHK